MKTLKVSLWHEHYSLYNECRIHAIYSILFPGVYELLGIILKHWYCWHLFLSICCKFSHTFSILESYWGGSQILLWESKFSHTFLILAPYGGESQDLLTLSNYRGGRCRGLSPSTSCKRNIKEYTLTVCGVGRYDLLGSRQTYIGCQFIPILGFKLHLIPILKT